MSFYKFARNVCLFGLRFAYRIRYYGEENLPTNKGYILASNHVSNLDPVFIGIGCNKDVRFMAKIELFKNPIFGAIIRGLGAFPVSRGTGDFGAIEKAIDVVKSGDVLGIFPEGTRSKDGKLGRAKSGAVVVASKTGGDIVPVGIKYGKKVLWRRCIDVFYGNPITNEKLAIIDNSKSEIRAACHLLMQNIANLLGVEI